MIVLFEEALLFVKSVNQFFLFSKQKKWILFVPDFKSQGYLRTPNKVFFKTNLCFLKLKKINIILIALFNESESKNDLFNVYIYYSHFIF